jgi:undecaprenyl pyrophosphate synthase
MTVPHIGHVLVIPDGNRRHARRAYLVDRLRESPAALRAALAGLEAGAAEALAARIAAHAASGADAGAAGDASDALDHPSLPAPLLHLLASYRTSARVLDELIRTVLTTGAPSVLSIYAMQPKNLARSDDEVEAFVRAETEAQERWAGDAVLCARASFRFVGDRALLAPERNRPALRAALASYLESARRLEARSSGGALRVNLLAPYDYAWELEQAFEAGHFDPARLAVPEEVDVVVRSGGGGRSLASGALPLQTAYSRHAIVTPYFPDCTVPLLLRAIESAAAAATRRGL